MLTSECIHFALDANDGQQHHNDRLSRVVAKSLTLDVGPIVRPADAPPRYPSPPCHNTTLTPTIRLQLGMNREPFVRPSLRLRTMAMLRVSSYRRLFEEQCWRQNGASVVSRRSPGRSVCVDLNLGGRGRMRLFIENPWIVFLFLRNYLVLIFCNGVKSLVTKVL